MYCKHHSHYYTDAHDLTKAEASRVPGRPAHNWRRSGSRCEICARSSCPHASRRRHCESSPCRAACALRVWVAEASEELAKSSVRGGFHASLTLALIQVCIY